MVIILEYEQSLFFLNSPSSKTPKTAADLPFEASERLKSLLDLLPIFTRLRRQKTTALAAKSPATQAKESVSQFALAQSYTVKRYE